MTRALTVITGLLMLAMSGTPAQAGANCSRQDVRIDGDLGGGPFSVPARLGAAPGPNIGLSEKDCVQQNLNSLMDETVARAMAAVRVSDGDPGLYLGLTGTNGGLTSATSTALGVGVGWTSEPFSQGSLVERISIDFNLTSLADRWQPGIALTARAKVW